MKESRRRIAVLPGDGIGADVTSAALPVFGVLGTNCELLPGSIGWECWRDFGNPIPDATWELIETSDATLVGAVTSKPAREAAAELRVGVDSEDLKYVSPVIQLRQRLALSTNYRPVLDLRDERFDLVVLRENTEGLYAGFDEYPVTEAMWRTISTHPNSQESGREGSAVTVRLQTRSATEALLTRAFELALARKKKVTVADKPNVLRNSSQLLREVVEQVSADHPGVDVEILNVDAVAMWMVTRPSRFDVIVAENMFGDILSDVGAGVMGGLGLASSANIGDRHAYFEPVHGSAPHLAGSGRANPMAMFLTIASLLEHLGETRSAALVRDAVRTVYREGRTLTYDLGGSASTNEVAAAVIAEVARKA